MKTLRHLLILVPVLLSLLPVQAQNQPTAPAPAPVRTQATAKPATSIDPEKLAQIRKLLQLTGTVSLVQKMKDHMLDGFRKERPDVPDSVWLRVSSEMDITTLLEEIIPLYDKYYTLEDLELMNAFYESPVGQKMIASNPQIARASSEFAQNWETEVGQQAEKEVSSQSAGAPARQDSPH